MSNASWIRSALERFEAPLTRYAFGITGDLERARDVVQDTFLRLCSQSPARLDGRVAPWLFKVCRNRALDVRKKEARTLSLDDGRSESWVSPNPTPSAELEAKEGLTRVLALLMRLPENQREVLRLKFQNELSYREISEITGLSTTNVGFLIHRGLRSLRESLQRDSSESSQPAKPSRSFP
jgi:RNA polymerase sigma-70 factor (ECF subfamily)